MVIESQPSRRRRGIEAQLCAGHAPFSPLTSGAVTPAATAQRTPASRSSHSHLLPVTCIRAPYLGKVCVQGPRAGGSSHSQPRSKDVGNRKREALAGVPHRAELSGHSFLSRLPLMRGPGGGGPEVAGPGLWWGRMWGAWEHLPPPGSPLEKVPQAVADQWCGGHSFPLTRRETGHATQPTIVGCPYLRKFRLRHPSTREGQPGPPAR